jgi:hypothetical protein
LFLRIEELKNCRLIRPFVKETKTNHDFINCEGSFTTTSGNHRQLKEEVEKGMVEIDDIEKIPT